MTALERDNPDTFNDEYAFRSKVEGTPSRIKRLNSRMRLRRRKNDPDPTYPDVVVDGDLDQSLSDLPEDVLNAVIDAAQESVGIARLCEALSILIVHNLRAIVMLEELTGGTCDFRPEVDFSFTPIRTIRQRDVDPAAA